MQPPLPNPALRPLATLIGDWTTTGSHPLAPDTTLHGRSSFRWLEGGAFLIWHSQIDHKDFPAGTAIFGSDDATGECFILYYDERKVSRKYNVSLEGSVLTWWRDAPGFSQKYTWTFADGGDTIIGKGQLCKDGTTWEDDLDLNFTRVK